MDFVCLHNLEWHECGRSWLGALEVYKRVQTNAAMLERRHSLESLRKGRKVWTYVCVQQYHFHFREESPCCATNVAGSRCSVLAHDR